MDYAKIAPGLLTALEDLESEGRPALQRHARTLGITHVGPVAKPPGVVVFLVCAPDATAHDLGAAFNVHINQPYGRVRTAYLPIERLRDVTDLPAVERIVPARYLRLKMDLACTRCHIPAFRTRVGASGRGVVVGVVDSGIDPNHPAFAGRIRSIWDQTLNGNGVAEGNYGLEVSGHQLAASRDTHGHGTHVAGIAAGDHPQFAGVAPEADLVIVKSTLQDAHIADGMQYIFRAAKQLNRPAVVNLSLGGHFDAHDGTDALSALVDQESGPGRIVCCAAGNEGDDNIHAALQLSSTTTRQVRVSVPRGSSATINAWYSGSDRIEVAIQSPDGFRTPFQAPIVGGPFTSRHNLPMGSVAIATPPATASNGDHQIEVTIAPSSQATESRTIWRLVVRPLSIVDGRLDLWAIDDEGGTRVIFTSDVEDSMKIGSPGAARSALTVASYTTRTEWLDVAGVSRAIGLTPDDISSFSSEGPLRRGALKPDLAAPGAMLAAPASADAGAGLTIAPGFRVDAGTSMATPFVAGVVALMLQGDPDLTPDAVRQLLKAQCAVPARPAGAHDGKWGFGLLDAQGL